jgi:predicted RNase H-like HicB family nuclease
MKTYDLYLESGPQKKTTVVHVPELLGCTFNAPTTDQALADAPEAVRAYLRFLARNGERADAEAPFSTRVEEHRTDGGFLGSAFLPTDTKPRAKSDSDRLMARLDALHAGLRALTDGLTPRQLDAKPARGRPIRGILEHVCGEGGYLRGVSGASRIQRDVAEKRLDPRDALDRLHALEARRLTEMPAAERRDVVMRGQSPWSARAALRRMLEHAWEHYTEIAARLGVTP